MRILTAVAVAVALIADIAWVVWDWENTVESLITASVLAILVPTALALPLFLWFLMRERSHRGAWTRTWSACRRIGGWILSEL